MKSAGKARSNGLYRHIRTSKEIIRNLLNDSQKIIMFCRNVPRWKSPFSAFHLRSAFSVSRGFLYRHLGQFTRNYTQTTKRGLLTTNKG